MRAMDLRQIGEATITPFPASTSFPASTWEGLVVPHSGRLSRGGLAPHGISATGPKNWLNAGGTPRTYARLTLLR